jgi:hypothetical protein
VRTPIGDEADACGGEHLLEALAYERAAVVEHERIAVSL